MIAPIEMTLEQVESTRKLGRNNPLHARRGAAEVRMETDALAAMSSENV